MSNKGELRVAAEDEMPTAESTRAQPRTDDIVTLRHVSVRYQLRKGLLSRHREEVVAVDDVTLSIPHGATLGLVGTTGSGKSTIAHVVMGMVEPTSGSVMIGGHEVYGLPGAAGAAPSEAVQVVLQDPYSSLDPRMKVGDIIAEPITRAPRKGKRPSKTEVESLVSELLVRVGLPADSANQYPQQFSGGQRQRIAIARALGPQPDLIILDEPTSALDVSVRAQILDLLKSLQQELGLTYLIISHDLVTVLYLASTISVMHQGRLVESGPAMTVYKSPQHPYTLELLASVPGVSGRFLIQAQSSGGSASVPNAACRFASDCSLRPRLGNPAICIDDIPELVEVQPLHLTACHFPTEVTELALGIDRFSNG